MAYVVEPELSVDGRIESSAELEVAPNWKQLPDAFLLEDSSMKEAGLSPYFPKELYKMLSLVYPAGCSGFFYLPNQYLEGELVKGLKQPHRVSRNRSCL
ncbi:MAG: hypothetical protein MK135_09300 [Polyangiaceae bacterium]|nr:hypothetical protein [Polyangiaceae bacterium]